MVLRIAALLGAIALSVLTGVTARAAPSSPLPTVGCDQIIGPVKSPRQARYRPVLGYLSVPPPYLAQVVRVRGFAPWVYWRKAGLVVRDGRVAVSVSVPEAWRKRAAITWGNTGIVSSLRIAACLPSSVGWHAYAGGFYLRSRAACVPLVFRMGKRRATVRFGIGRRCGAGG
jgi:hypothetical protein